ncbi:MAG: hypothetical protein FMNOHCHN_03778 [Ignavibacteriaceae bacterium]|nr:hypothetical protein [Ignavibacteriaceae bacterium]
MSLKTYADLEDGRTYVVVWDPLVGADSSVEPCIDRVYLLEQGKLIGYEPTVNEYDALEYEVQRDIDRNLQDILAYYNGLPNDTYEYS